MIQAQMGNAQPLSWGHDGDTGDPSFIDGRRAKQRAKPVARELKLPRGIWEHCTDPPMFALRISLRLLNQQNDFAKLLN